MTTSRKDQARDAVTADDVAEQAGVSRWTVSRAFKQEASISAKSRKKVLDAAERLGYVPDLLAASLASDRSNLVAVLVDDFSNPHKLVMMERMTRIMRKHGWDTLLVNTLDAADASTALLNARQRRVDAAIMIGVKFNDQAVETAHGAHRVRKLILFARYSENPDTISICCDDEAAMSTITDYVIEKGYARPHFLAGPQTQSAHLLRKETFLRRWRDSMGTEAGFTFVNGYDPHLAYQHITDLLGRCSKAERPDILVCENDALAMGAVDAIRYEFGLRVPEDIAITGFDDVPQAASPHYRLTTYRQPISAMVEGLVEVLKGQSTGPGLSKFVGQMVVRESA